MYAPSARIFLLQIVNKNMISDNILRILFQQMYMYKKFNKRTITIKFNVTLIKETQIFRLLIGGDFKHTDSGSPRLVGPLY